MTNGTIPHAARMPSSLATCGDANDAPSRMIARRASMIAVSGNACTNGCSAAGKRDAMLIKQRGSANQHRLAVNRCLNAATGDGSEICGRKQTQFARFSFGHDCTREGMLGVALGAGGDLQQA